MTDTDTSNLQYGVWSVNANDLPPKAIAYLLHNGFNQSMTDAAAFTKAQKEGKSADEVTAMAREARQKRFDAICQGTVGIRVGGTRLPAIDRVMREIAEETLRGIAAERHVAMPKGDVLKAALDKIIARNADAIRAKARARLDEQKANAESFSLDDLLDGPSAQPEAQAAE